jgi:hypothetical protein
MPRYQVVAPHDAAECIQALDDMLTHDADLLSHIAYGCHVDDHTGYGVIEASDEAEVRRRLPQSVGRWARIVKVEHITPEDIRAKHDHAV